MVGRRKPLVLASTKTLVDSVLSSSQLGHGDRVDNANDSSSTGSCSSLQLTAGILRFPKPGTDVQVPKLASLDDSALIGVSTSVLKTLSVTSGSPVLAKNVETGKKRIAQTVVLDPPDKHKESADTELSSSAQFSREMLIFPSCTFPETDPVFLDREVAYVSPMLAFNLDLHVLCFKSLVQGGEETIASYFKEKLDYKICGKGIENSVIGLQLEPLRLLPRYASHLRVSFVRVPECGVLGSLKGSSSLEAEERQVMIDLALQNYFEVDRFLVKGDIFGVRINWNCKSVICVPCSRSSKSENDGIIYFKVVAMEPSDEPVLRVNRTQTALVLGGNAPSAVPPDLLVAGPEGFSPLQEETVKLLASVLTPAICPSTLSSKFRVSVLLHGIAGCGKRTVVRYVARRLGLHVVEYSCHNLMAASERKTSVTLAQAFNTAQRYSPTIILLRHFDVFRNLASQEGSPNDHAGISSEVASVIREFTEPVSEDEEIDSEGKLNGEFYASNGGMIQRHPVLLVAAADGSEGLPPTIRRCFSHEISMGPLTEEQRVTLLSQSLQRVSKLLPDTDMEDFVKDIVGQTSGFMPRDMHALIADAGASLFSRVNIPVDLDESKNLNQSLRFQAEPDGKSCEGAPLVLGKENLTKALERSKKRNASALGTPKVPNVKWEDVGGLEDVKKSILDTVQLPLLHRDLFSSGLRKRSGVLLYGPPGTGKTLLAKAVATECSLNFLSVKGPELINMYIGESEKNVRDIFQKARSARPCVIFFDELDSLAPARGASGDSGGVMDRVMLAEIDGLNDSTQDLFIIGASNRPDLIDAALLRPGRFDKLLYVGVNSDASYRERVLKALTRKFKLHQDISLYSIAKKCPPNFTGADMYALCADAWFNAAKRKVSSSDSDSSSMDDQVDSVVVEHEDFVEVLRDLAPSLSMTELKKYELLRDQFEGASKKKWFGIGVFCIDLGLVIGSHSDCFSQNWFWVVLSFWLSQMGSFWMISVGSRDGRKGLGLGFGGGSRREDMEDTELEEGEAHSYQNNDDFDASIDPDIAYSYLDEKLQDVLGHFQKDFEGGVSAENLGAKFGGYGSFLPTYQRSPVWSHRTPPKVQSYSTSRSPNNLHLEGGHCNSVVSSTAPQSGGRGPTSASSTSLPALKASSINELGKQEVSMPAARAEELAPRLDSKNKKPTSASDQKTLKVRIKVGSDNLSTRKNAAIYSGLGLDDSPSSSLDDSPSESEGISHERPPFESPTSILQIMTSFPVHGSLLLSPLHDDLICLLEKEKLPKESRWVPVAKGAVESSGLINGSDTLKSNGKALGEKNVKSIERNDYSAESKSGNDKDARIQDFSRKEPDLDALACEELVSNTLKLPILSNSYSTSGDKKRSKEVNKSVLKDKIFSDHAEEQLESTFVQEDAWIEKEKASSTVKSLIEVKETSANEISVHPNKEGEQKGEKTYEVMKSDSIVTKARKTVNTEATDFSKQKVNKKTPCKEQENARLPHGKENPVPGEKKKSKGSQGTLAAEVPKESLRASSSMPKTKKSNTMDHHTSNSGAENVKSRKDLVKNTDRYKDFFGELDEDNPMDMSANPSEDKLREFDVSAKSSSAINGLPKERRSGKKIEKASTSEAFPLSASSPRSGNGPLSDAAPPPGPPVPVLHEEKENWVCCDKCQRWRLLPTGTNPDDLPEKWLCSMLNWLPPGLNRCSVTEEETTKALLQMYPPPLPESQANLNSNPGGLFMGTTFANFRHPDQNPRDSGGKKKHSLKVMSNLVNKDSPTQLSNSTKRNMQASVKSRSLNDVNNSPLANDPDFQQYSKSNDLITENQKHKYKEKNREVEPHAFGGDTKNLKTKSRRDSDQDSSRASKKFKTDAKNSIDEGWASDHSGAVGKVGPSSSGGFPTSSAGKDRTKYSNRSSSKDSKFDVKDKLQVPIAKAKVKAEVSLDNRDNMKKRKSKEFQNGSCPSTGRHLPDGTPFVKEEFSDTDYRKEKKPRISRSDGKESSASKGNGRTNKKCSHSKDQQNLDGMDSSKTDLGPIQASLAATSSSSKVSGSHKTKSSFQEVKGSPVESVSSSPMRISNPDKFTSVGRDVIGKDELQHVGNFAIHSPKRTSDGEDFGGNDFTHVERKDNASIVAYHGSLESSVQDFRERDFSHLSKSKTRRQVMPSPDIRNHNSVNGALDNIGQDTEYPSKQLASGKFGDEEKQNENHYHVNGSRSRKSAKGSSSRLEKNRSFKSDFDTVKVKSSDDFSELHGCSPSGEIKSREGKSKMQEKFGVRSDEIEEKVVNGRKDVTGKPSGENCKRESQPIVGGRDGVDLKVDATYRKDTVSTPQQNALPDINDERSSKRLVSDKTDQVETVSSGERSVLLPASGGPQGDTLNRCPEPAIGTHKGNGVDTLHVDSSEGNNALKVPKQIRKADNQNRSQQMGSRHPSKTGHRARDLDAPSPIRKDLPSHAATNALKEAKDLKHMADRLKSSGSNHERTRLYFEAALKFLYGASLLESGSSESANHSEMVRSRQTYSETAKLCEFCAHEYEKSKDMAAAALAYKCTEVAYMRVIYSLHASASRDRHELQTALQVVPLGESPSSSASDVDNLNNHTIADKVALPKGVNSPQVATNHVIAARNRPNFVRLLNFAQDVSFAMEASRKSQVAFAAASNANLVEAKSGEAISSTKRALDYNFQDVDGLLRLISFLACTAVPQGCLKFYGGSFVLLLIKASAEMIFSFFESG
ncbi:Spastin [Trema orientale]|uniref:Peroxisomal ATPase PEX6 n=1 Tax=Trema orientale TaxID=63057 RepID=A0A2P5FFS6_TREOI|nr:Spastin [Trema orientale]